MELFGKPKKVTRKMLNLLSPLGIAIWYMDDGCLDQRFYRNKLGGIGVAWRRAKFSTNSFTLKEHYIMQRYFQVVHGMKASICKSGKGYCLHLNRQSTEKLIELIRPYVHESMLYKIDLTRGSIKELIQRDASHTNESDDIVCTSMKVEEDAEMTSRQN